MGWVFVEFTATLKETARSNQFVPVQAADLVLSSSLAAHDLEVGSFAVIHSCWSLLSFRLRRNSDSNRSFTSLV